MGSLNTHAKALRALPYKQRRRICDFWTPFDSSWLDLVECYFATPQRTALQNTDYRTAAETNSGLRKGARYLSRNPKAYKWKKTWRPICVTPLDSKAGGNEWYGVWRDPLGRLSGDASDGSCFSVVTTQALHDHVPEEEVHVLSELHVIGMRADHMTCAASEASALILAQTESDSAMAVGIIDGSNHVLGVAATRDGEHKVACLEKIPKLLDEDVLK